MEVLFYFFVFILGAIVGSFLNVVILRHGTGITIMGRSFCFSCRKQLSWRDLFPVLSFLSLGGRCRFCKSKISRQYITIETLTGIIFALIFWKFGGTDAFMASLAASTAYFFYLFKFVFYAAIFSLLIVIGVYDAKHKIIPDDLAYAFAALAFLSIIFLPQTPFEVPTIWNLLSGPILALPLAALWYFSGGRWIGLGDAKLMLGIGWFLGLLSGFASLILAFWTGAAVGVAFIMAGKIGQSSLFRRKITIKSELPFAPFLILGFSIAVFMPEVARAVSQLFFSCL